MIYVPDVAQALDWYVSIGFKELNRFDDDGVVNFWHGRIRERRTDVEHARKAGST